MLWFDLTFLFEPYMLLLKIEEKAAAAAAEDEAAAEAGVISFPWEDFFVKLQTSKKHCLTQGMNVSPYWAPSGRFGERRAGS